MPARIGVPTRPSHYLAPLSWAAMTVIVPADALAFSAPVSRVQS